MQGWIDEAHEVADAHHRWLGLEFSHIFTTVAGTSLYDAPADWMEGIGEPWYFTGPGAAKRVEWIPSTRDARKDHSASVAIEDRGRPVGIQEIYAASGASPYRFQIYPIPDQSNTTGTYSALGDYQLEIPYRRKAPALVADSVLENFYTEVPNLALFLTDYASGKAMLFNRDFENGQTYLLMARAHLVRETQLDKRRRTRDIKITPRRDVHASRRQRRAI